MVGCSFHVIDVGTKNYDEAYVLQMNMVEKRLQGFVNDTLLLVEHPPVITLGRSGAREHLLVSEDFLLEKGIFFVETNRGGDITYHGPGQLVVYLILQLIGGNRDLNRLARKYEEVIILTLASFGIKGLKVDGCTGVWVDGRKVAAIGVGVRSWVTFHGLALNVNVDLTPFSYIIPCGIRGKGVTSMESILGQEVDMGEVKEQVTKAFVEVFKTNAPE